MIQKLDAESLRGTCDPQMFRKFSLSENSQAEIIGQDRAVNALKFGVGIKAEGFNIFVSGAPGTGRLTAVKSFVEEPAKKEPLPPDWCYVNNFKDPYQPKMLTLPAGNAHELKNEIRDFIRDARLDLVKAFESEEYANRRKRIIEALESQQTNLFAVISAHAEKENLLLKQTPWEILTQPMKDGEAMTDEEFNSLDKKQQNEIRAKQFRIQDELKIAIRESRNLEKAANRKLVDLEKEVAGHSIGNLMEELSEKFTALKDVLQYLDEVKEDILNNLPEFLSTQKENTAAMLFARRSTSFPAKYEVNVLTENSKLAGAPVVIELNPTYHNLFGRVEKESTMGMLYTDFTLIRKGSLHAANGGYLIIRVEELFRNLFSYDALKRALRNKEIVIEEAGDQWGLMSTKTLKPQAIPLNVKVILIGNPLYYHLLYMYDNDFRELFKVKADFDTSMERSVKNINNYFDFANTITAKEKLLPPDDSALAKFTEYGSRLAEDQHKLSTRFGELSNILNEANHYAVLEQSKNISASHILKAIDEKVYRSNMLQEKISELIENNQLFIDIKGEKTGQVNGLSVIDLGDISFGRPSRITCSVSLGKEGIIAIEREAELSGPIHTKGVMILTGYLSEKFNQDKPVSLAARIVFEQSYSEIEGDSASSAELYSILSNLSNLPIKQGIAVTGSVNQKGEVQPIGGVNEKIEGYFEICKKIGLNGEQGVVIPASNRRNLMLKEEVVAAVKSGKFNLWAVDRIEEGIEILTGVKGGSAAEEGTVFFLVGQALNSYAEKMRIFSMEEEGGRRSIEWVSTSDLPPA